VGTALTTVAHAPGSVLSLSQAPKPSQGPHKTRECLPLLLILRNRLK
jgi:ribosomal protein S4E